MTPCFIKWRDAGTYLPPILRDFHDQKNIFKAVHRLIDVKEHEYVKDVSWAQGQCYVIDIFLWFMARVGYTLQKSRASQQFDSLDEALKFCAEERYQGLLTKSQAPSTMDRNRGDE